MKRLKIEVGTKFNELTYVGFSHMKSKKIMSIFDCSCGKRVVKMLTNVVSGNTKSCGHIKDEMWTKHGMKGTSEYQCWQGLKKRCLNGNDKAYKYYGGRGIKVCDRWLNSFENFIEDMGRKPTEKHTIDRIDNNGNYEPNNCRWATMKEQNNNKGY